jgi:hypothetical protein
MKENLEYVEEVFTDDRDAQVVLDVARGVAPNQLVIRNASESGASEFVLGAIHYEPQQEA